MGGKFGSIESYQTEIDRYNYIHGCVRFDVAKVTLKMGETSDSYQSYVSFSSVNNMDAVKKMGINRTAAHLLKLAFDLHSIIFASPLMRI
jgi:hypothetical protein